MITVARVYVYGKSRNMEEAHPLHFVVFKVHSAILGPLQLHTNFRISLLISTNNPGILMGVV